MNGKQATKGFSVDFECFVLGDVFGEKCPVVDAAERVASSVAARNECLVR